MDLTTEQLGTLRTPGTVVHPIWCSVYVSVLDGGFWRYWSVCRTLYFSI